MHHASNNSLNASGGSIKGGQVDGESLLELQRLLRDERSRATQHKLHYQQLKAELENLQGRHKETELELATCVAEHNTEADELNRQLALEERRLSELEREAAVLRGNQVTERRIEMIRLKLEEEFEGVYCERTTAQRAETEAARAETVRLRQENARLQAELDHGDREHARVQEELRLIHEAEVSTYKSERSRLLLANVVEPAVDAAAGTGNSMKLLQQENAVLKGQLKLMSGEMTEGRTKLEQTRSRLEEEVRNKGKQATEAVSGLRRSEIETESLRRQIAEAQRSVAAETAGAMVQTQRAAEMERESRALRGRLDEVTHKSRVELALLSAEATKQRADIDRHRQLQAARIDELEDQLRLAGSKCGQLESRVAEAQQARARREAADKETHWGETQQLQTTLAQLQDRLAQTETQLRHDRAAVDSSTETRAQQAEQKQQEAEREVDSTKSRLETLSSDLKKSKTSLAKSTTQILHQEAELDECYTRLAHADVIRKEAEGLRQRLAEMESKGREEGSAADRTRTEAEAGWRSDRERLTVRIGQLEEELGVAMERARLLQEELRRKNKKHSSYFSMQKKKIQISSGRVEELKAEVELLRGNVPAEEYQQVRKELKELHRRHQEYRAIISSSGEGGGSGNYESGRHGDEREFEHGLEQLRQRLQYLDDRQRAQMPQLERLLLVPGGSPDRGSDEKGDREKEGAREDELALSAVFSGPKGDI